MEHWATVQKSTTRILLHVDTERDIRGIIFLRVELSGGAAYAEMSRLLHKSFPNLTVALREGSVGVAISVAITRGSLAEWGATVVESADATGAFDPADGAWAGLRLRRQAPGKRVHTGLRE